MSDRQLIIIGTVVVLFLLLANSWILWSWKQVALRNHNLDVFYKTLTCDDLPIKEDSSVEACQEAIGKFMLPENGLFTRDIDQGRN